MPNQNENTDTSLLSGNNENTTQAQSDETSLLTPETKEQNAFQVMQKQINALKSQLEIKTKEFDSLKSELQKNSGKEKQNILTEQSESNNVIAEMNKILTNFKADIEGKLTNINNSVTQQQEDIKIEKLNQSLENFSNTYGLENWQVERFVNAMDISNSGFENNFEGKLRFLMQYVDTPKIIEMELIKVSPKDIETALKNKQQLDTKTINKQKTATIRAGSYNTNPNTNRTESQQIVKDFLDKETKKVELKFIGKVQ